jgi:homoserine O-acetyltransferase
MVRSGGPINTDKFRVIGCDFAPGNHADVPDCITTHDQAARLVDLLDHLKIDKFAAIVGSSYGGMAGLAFAQNHPDRIGNLCVIGAAHRPFPIGVGWRGIQRRIARLGQAGGNPEGGLKLARELAMTTYRTPEEFSDRFKLNETHSNPALFDICDYLGSRGDAFAKAMDAKRFLTLSESIDLHSVEPERISTPTLLMSAISDQLAPLSEMRELRDRLAGPSELYTFTSLFGHDAFLKEFDMMTPPLENFCNGLT